MRPSLLVTTLATSAAAVCIPSLGPTAVAHADQTAQETIDQLQSEGYTVNVDRVGSGRIEDCAGHQRPQSADQTRNSVTTTVRRDANGDRKYRIVEVVVSRSISVSLDCTT